MYKAVGDLLFYRFGHLEGVRHGITTRQGGVSSGPYDSLNLSLSVPDRPANVAENRRRVAEALEAARDRVVSSRQVHGAEVLAVDDGHSPGGPLPSADAQVTDRPGWLLSLRFADCVPLLFWHPERGVVGAAHAGWRGTLAGVGPATARTLRERYGAEPDGLRVGIGPSIGPCCYEVGEEVAERFAAWPNGVVRRAGARPHLDLGTINRLMLMAGGVPAESIETAGVCTRCHADRFFSHRAHGYPAGRFGAFIGLSV